MTQLHAQPYDLAAAGFYFETVEEYSEKAAKLRNDYGDPVEEFEIQFIDGASIDCDLAQAIGLYQGSLDQYFDAVKMWSDDQKQRVIIAVGEVGYSFDANKNPDSYDIDIYHTETLRELAEQFVDEGLFGDIPEQFQFYIDYEAIARDLGFDYSETEIAGQYLIYRAA